MNRWKRFWSWRQGKQALILGLLLSFLVGCTSQNPYLYQGAGLGALLGGGLGAAINNRNPWKGAAIGAMLGGAGGGIAGEIYGQSKQPYQPQPQGSYYQPAPQPYYGTPAPQPGYSTPAPPPYSYNPPRASDNYAYNAPAAPSGSVRTPVSPAPYYE